MDNHRFVLEKYTGAKSRFTCPGCGAERRFTRYIDSLTGDYVSLIVGKCDREVSCGYHLTPKQYFTTNPDEYRAPTVKLGNIPPPPPPSFHDPEIMKRSLACYDRNNLMKYLDTLFGTEKAVKAAAMYNIGTSKHWAGATIFWQVDSGGKVHAGKVILYDPTTGHRDKSKHITWVHSICKLEGFVLNQRFFGVHLIGNSPIGIVESEKTAVIASVYLPQFTWIATGAKGMLSPERCKGLGGHKVVLFPDLGAFDDWKKVADKLHFGISDLLEKYATEEERNSGFDLADYLVRFDVSQFERKEKPVAPCREYVPVCEAGTWDIGSLEDYFSTNPVPSEIRLNNYTMIHDLKQFVSSHLGILKANSGNPICEPYKNRLAELISAINKN